MPTNKEMIYNSIKVALKIHGLQLDTIDVNYLAKKEMKDPKALSYIDPETFDVIFNEDLVEKATDRRPLIIESFHIVRHYVQRAYVKYNRWATDIPKFEKNLIPRWRADFRLQDDPNKIKRKPEFYQKLDSEIDAKAFGYIIALHEFGFEDTLPELTKDEILDRALELEYEFGYKERPVVIEPEIVEKEEINPNDDLYVIETDENGMLVYKLRKKSDDEILIYGSDGSESMTDEEKKKYEDSLASMKERESKIVDEEDEDDIPSKDDTNESLDSTDVNEKEDSVKEEVMENPETTTEDVTLENVEEPVEVVSETIDETPIEDSTNEPIEPVVTETKKEEPLDEEDIPRGSIAAILSRIKRKQVKVSEDEDILEYEMEEIEEYI